jgi:hypothetical protein
MELLNEYEFDINHIKGNNNRMVNAISRRVHEMHATTISMYKSNLKEIIMEDEKSINIIWKQKKNYNKVSWRIK